MNCKLYGFYDIFKPFLTPVSWVVFEIEEIEHWNRHILLLFYSRRVAWCAFLKLSLAFFSYFTARYLQKMWMVVWNRKWKVWSLRKPPSRILTKGGVNSTPKLHLAALLHFFFKFYPKHRFCQYALDLSERESNLLSINESHHHFM